MAAKTTRLGFEDLIAKVKTKSVITNIGFVTLNLKDAALLLWRETKTDPASLGILLTTISSNPSKLEVLAMKPEGGFIRYDLNLKYCDRQLSKLALGISICIDKVIRSQPSYKLLERESIKGVLNAGVFGVLPKAAAHYLPQPEVAPKVPAPAVAVVETDEDDDEIDEDICQTKQHEAERWAAAKKPTPKDKGKVVVLTQPKKKPAVSSQAPREKLLGSSINAEKARQNRESLLQTQNCGSNVDDKKRKHESITPTPPPKVNTSPAKEEYSSSEEESDTSERERRAVDTSDIDDDSDSPPPTQPVTKKVAG
ncbi:hypothetical protein R1sor_024010 [Riccia sorocarpa]|uniref:Uncharacterized protein n=1 Tax=Riccia sorocarpa TaxID=122646 RepID=A0ABD3GTB3_9MARC